MDPRSIYESYPPGSLDRNPLWTFVSGSGSSGREIWTHPKVALPFYPLLHSTQGCGILGSYPPVSTRKNAWGIVMRKEHKT